MKTIIKQSIVAMAVVALSSMTGLAQQSEDAKPAASEKSGQDQSDKEEGFTSLFDGSTLDGWEQKNGTATYEILDGTICGRTAKGLSLIHI